MFRNRSLLYAEDQFRWVGDCLLYAEADLDGFVAGVLARCPEVAAAERALEMKARIELAPQAPADGETDTTPARRRAAGV